jgi:phospholipid/cholesterol/gamma-HCH transport system substrate-binding protein
MLETAPEVLAPGTAVVEGLGGEHPDRDLQALVKNLSTTADVLTRRDGQLASIAENLHTTAVTLSEHRVALRETVHTLPETIRAAHEGIDGLDDSVLKLRTAAKALQPSTPHLRNLVDRLQPLLVETRPLMANLRPLLDTARPTVRQLVPVAERATGVLGDLHGPVLDRVNGPVTRFVLNPWTGTGPYDGAPMGYMKDHPFYKELAYMATNVDRGSMTQDQHGSTLAFQVGAGLDSVWLGGTPFDMPNLLKLALDTSGVKDPAKRKRVLGNAGVTR